MLRVFIGFFAVFLNISIVGCAWFGAAQQSRFEIAESAKVFIARPQGLFFSPQVTTVDRRADGSITVHSVSGDSSAIGSRSLSGVTLSDATLTQLNEALLPFLLPACQAVAPFQQQ